MIDEATPPIIPEPDADMIDWTTCPHCIQPLTIIRVIPRYEWRTPVTLTLEDGDPVIAELGETEYVEMDEGPQDYMCAACQAYLPEEYWYELSDLLV